MYVWIRDSYYQYSSMSYYFGLFVDKWLPRPKTLLKFIHVFYQTWGMKANYYNRDTSVHNFITLASSTCFLSPRFSMINIWSYWRQNLGWKACGLLPSCAPCSTQMQSQSVDRIFSGTSTFADRLTAVLFVVYRENPFSTLLDLQEPPLLHASPESDSKFAGFRLEY